MVAHGYEIIPCLHNTIGLGEFLFSTPPPPCFEHYNIHTRQSLTQRTIQKWETRMGSSLPLTIWQDKWLPYRAAKENAFLWQILFQALALH